jgi:hypothetical protein
LPARGPETKIPNNKTLRQLNRSEIEMIKRFCMMAAASLMLLSGAENESWAQGFGGFHRARGRRVVAASRYGYGGYYRSGSYGYGVGYGNVGNPYGAVGGTTYIGGMRVGGAPPTQVSLGPAPGPVGVDSIGTKRTETDLRAYNREALDKSLSQMKLPSDAGLPAAGSKNDDADKKKR